MSILPFPVSAARRARPWSTRLPVAWSELVRSWRIRQASHAMQGLPDELLHDIGVGRGEIEQVVRHGRVGRP